MSENELDNLINTFIVRISKSLDDIAESLNEISEFLYNKDEAKTLQTDMKEAVKEVADEFMITDKTQEKFKSDGNQPTIIESSPGFKSVSNKIFDIHIKSETEKALLIKSNTTNKVAWIPRKAVKTLSIDNNSLVLQDWFKGKVQWKEDEPW